ncbi:MAG: MFS transporter [Firmicutes bacterium]|nr:MFS transporter [Bacillota bacterium]
MTANNNQANSDSKLLQTEIIEAETTSPETAIIETTTRRGRLFISLRYPEYRYLWSGAFLSNIGTWIQSVALGWFVFQVTNSEFSLGLVNFTSSLPTFFLALVGGVIADRYERRSLLIISQIILMVLAFVLGLLVSLRVANILIILAISLAAGIASSFNFPAWQALIPELVPRKDLMNAVALNSAQFNAARLVGPAVAGIIIARLGVAPSFYINALSFLAVIVALVLIKPRPVKTAKVSGNIWQNLISGINYARRDISIAMLLISLGILSIFGMSHTVLMPVFARDILKVGPGGLGYLMAASGFGAVLGALIVAGLSHSVQRKTLIKFSILSYSIFLFIFALSREFIVSIIAQAGIGISFLISVSATNTSLQAAVPTEFRGRIMSLFVWCFIGLAPIGSFFIGSIANLLGSPTAVAIGAVILMLTSIMLFIRRNLLESAE